MERGGGEQQVEHPLRHRDLLEVAGHYLHARVLGGVVSGQDGEVLAELDAEHPLTTTGERQRRLARAAPDLEHPPPGRYAGERDDVLE